MTAFVCVDIHLDGAGGQRAGQPFQISQFEGQEDEADAVIHVHCTLWVQEVMRCPIPNIFLKTSSHCLVHPDDGTGVEDEEEEENGRNVSSSYIPNHKVMGVDQVTISRLSQFARVADHCAATTTRREGSEVQDGGGNYLEHLCHDFL